MAALEPDLALVDIELGEEDGIALARQFEVRAPSMRVVLISAYDPADVGELVGESRAAGFLPKSALGAEAIAASPLARRQEGQDCEHAAMGVLGDGKPQFHEDAPHVLLDCAFGDEEPARDAEIGVTLRH